MNVVESIILICVLAVCVAVLICSGVAIGHGITKKAYENNKPKLKTDIILVKYEEFSSDNPNCVSEIEMECVQSSNMGKTFKFADDTGGVYRLDISTVIDY